MPESVLNSNIPLVVVNVIPVTTSPEPPPPPAGAHVPSALKKFAVPPPDAAITSTLPDVSLVNILDVEKLPSVAGVSLKFMVVECMVVVPLAPATDEPKLMFVFEPETPEPPKFKVFVLPLLVALLN